MFTKEVMKYNAWQYIAKLFVYLVYFRLYFHINYIIYLYCFDNSSFARFVKGIAAAFVFELEVRGAVAERLRYRSREQSLGHQCWGDLSMLISIGYICLMLCAPLDWQYAELPSSASDAVLCSVLVGKMWDI